uniref:Putative secreted protein n=1 Tax=Rhipicephalus microplus TaxID=6941 RepID=A0A6G5A145_RHIMP
MSWLALTSRQVHFMKLCYGPFTLAASLSQHCSVTVERQLLLPMRKLSKVHGNFAGKVFTSPKTMAMVPNTVVAHLKSIKWPPHAL